MDAGASLSPLSSTDHPRVELQEEIASQFAPLKDPFRTAMLTTVLADLSPWYVLQPFQVRLNESCGRPSVPTPTCTIVS
jgi:hypothetical protein